MKKVFVLLLVLIMTVGMIGCGGGASGKSLLQREGQQSVWSYPH